MFIVFCNRLFILFESLFFIWRWLEVSLGLLYCEVGWLLFGVDIVDEIVDVLIENGDFNFSFFNWGYCEEFLELVGFFCILISVLVISWFCW